jgi:hypothetical protein
MEEAGQLDRLFLMALIGGAKNKTICDMYIYIYYIIYFDWVTLRTSFVLSVARGVGRSSGHSTLKTFDAYFNWAFGRVEKEQCLILKVWNGLYFRYTNQD